jgi:DtxR family transcriptional regulator, Mn-dependent transcriptional regulator
MKRDYVPFMGKRGSSESVEEYMETLMRLSEEKRKLSTGNIAEAMGVSAASVSEMLRKLEKEGYVSHEPYKEITLTAKGMRVGRKMLGRHRLLERFLEGMGLPRRKIHGEACKLEHYVSDDLEGLIRKRLDGPHGRSVVTLIDMAEGSKGSVFGIDGGEKAVRRLEDMGLTPGAKVRIVRSAPFSGPVEVCIRDSCLVLGRGVASKVFVRMVK